MKTKTFFQFDLGVFPSVVYVAIGYDNIGQIVDKLNVDAESKEEMLNDKKDGIAITYSFDNGNCCLFFYRSLYTTSELCILTHEVTHATQHILEFYDVPLNTDTAEVYAYTNHFIFREIMDRFQERKLCLKRK